MKNDVVWVTGLGVRSPGYVVSPNSSKVGENGSRIGIGIEGNDAALGNSVPQTGLDEQVVCQILS
jgi:hypothetical protein